MAIYHASPYHLPALASYLPHVSGLPETQDKPNKGICKSIAPVMLLFTLWNTEERKLSVHRRDREIPRILWTCLRITPL